MPPMPMTGRHLSFAQGIISRNLFSTYFTHLSKAACVTTSCRPNLSVIVTAPSGTETDSLILRFRTRDTSIEAPPRSNWMKSFASIVFTTPR